MRNVPKAILDKINSDAISDAFVPLLKFTFSDATQLCYLRYGSAVTYSGDRYEPWMFDGQLRFSGKGSQVPRATLTLVDVTQELRKKALATSWFAGSTVMLTIVCVAELAVSYTWSTVTFAIVHAVPQGEAVVMTLGGANIRKIRFPGNRYWAWQCPWALGFTDDPRCGYTGSRTNCNGTLSDCQQRYNTTRFGGFLGLDAGAAQLVVPLSLRGR